MAPSYMSGFGNEFKSEALAGALPVGQNSPHLALTGFTPNSFLAQLHRAARVNQRSWLYRIRPSVLHARRLLRRRCAVVADRARRARRAGSLGKFRWSPVPIPSERLTFVEAVRTMTTAGDADIRMGMSTEHLFRDAINGRRVFLRRGRRTSYRSRTGWPVVFHRDLARSTFLRRTLRRAARRQIQGRAHRWSRARLYVRELWRTLHFAEPRRDRGQLSR